MLYEMIMRPKWLLALLRQRLPALRHHPPLYWRARLTNEVIRFARSQMGGVFSWEEIARYRDKWKGPMLVKGILHPADAEKAVSLGIEGIWVSNHGGRQIEALAPSIDVLPAIVSAVGKGDHRARQRRPQRAGRDAGAGARRRGRFCRQELPLGGRRAGRSTGPAI